jgi:hypothetical protein
MQMVRLKLAEPSHQEEGPALSTATAPVAYTPSVGRAITTERVEYSEALDTPV